MELYTFSFTSEDIHLFTFALRKLKDETAFANVKKDAKDLLDYCERQKEENGFAKAENDHINKIVP